ncbi:HipA domain-containing protein [Deferribacterales bacterium RsTz2092]|nr:phosphatidylinositol kinase [Deferribacterales bacterium]
MVDKKVYVFIELEGVNQLVGQMWMHFRNGTETASFEYSQEWLENDKRFSLEPSLYLSSGVQHTNKKIFGAIGDSAPDRWGRALMKKIKTGKTLNEIDYLLLVNDRTRQGALRFKSDLEGEFLTTTSDMESIPPIVELSKLLAASENIVEDKETSSDLKLLFAPGSSLGGARPKASVIDNQGNLCIAKFPKKDDDSNVVLWEAVALSLAKLAGINTPNWRLVQVADKAVIVIKRFDRLNTWRIPFLSAMSMLGASDNDGQSYSYMDIADALRQSGAQPKDDLVELWRRIVFSILISNTDDHLRNHGFLYQNEQGWRLSPVYDLNPSADSTGHLHTFISQDDSTASLELALSVADYFGLNNIEATYIIDEVKSAVVDWAKVARGLNIPQTEIKRMGTAFYA